MTTTCAPVTRLLVLAPDPAADGGLEHATRNLLAALSSTWGRSNVGLMAVMGGQHVAALPVSVLDGGVTRRGRRVPFLRALAFTFSAVRAARSLRSTGLVIICGHANLAPVARLAAFLAGCPYTVWTHGAEVWGSIPYLTRAALRSADTVWVGCSYTASVLERLQGVPATRIRLLRYSLTPLARPAADVARHPRRVLAVAVLGSDRTYKGVDTLIRCWPLALREFPDAELLIVGDGDDRPRLERLAEGTGATGIRFAGLLRGEDLARAYASSSVFALPGRIHSGRRPEGEGFGLVFLEAASAGLPVIVGRAGGALEALVEGRTGLAVDPHSPDAVAAAIRELLRDPHRAQGMGAAGRRFVDEHFSESRFRNDVAALTHELVTGGRRG